MPRDFRTFYAEAAVNNGLKLVSRKISNFVNLNGCCCCSHLEGILRFQYKIGVNSDIKNKAILFWAIIRDGNRIITFELRCPVISIYGIVRKGKVLNGTIEIGRGVGKRNINFGGRSVANRRGSDSDCKVGTLLVYVEAKRCSNVRRNSD